MRKYAWEKYDEQKVKEVYDYAKGYQSFISKCKTERECVSEVIEMAKQHGFYDIKDVIQNQITLKKGDGVYANNMNKAIVLYRIGDDIREGMRIIGSHIDCPRMDIKANPLYENDGFAYLDTHYYGGIKKYQWTAIPLAMHGVVCLKDGTTIQIVIGEEDDDPVFGVSDLLVHLSSDQMSKKASLVIEGEQLDIIVGSKPINEEKESVKKAILILLKDKYGMEEDDFLSAELEIVPAGKARDFGLDRAMVYGYGQDDRSCAYTSLTAFFDEKEVKQTSVCLLVDKEEVGSNGATGMHSLFFENMCAEVMNACGCYSELNLRRSLSASKMLSSDVAAGYDPSFSSAFEKKNAAFLGQGICFMKFTGVRGKSGANDANAEYMAYLRSILDDANITYQTSEIGKVDQGGGGTISYILAKYDMEVIDCGIPVLNMHAPWELTSKADLYEGYQAYRVFLAVE